MTHVRSFTLSFLLVCGSRFRRPKIQECNLDCKRLVLLEHGSSKIQLLAALADGIHDIRMEVDNFLSSQLLWSNAHCSTLAAIAIFFHRNRLSCSDRRILGCLCGCFSACTHPSNSSAGPCDVVTCYIFVIKGPTLMGATYTGTFSCPFSSEDHSTQDFS